MTTTVETTISVNTLNDLGDRYDLTYTEIVGYALRVARGATMLDETFPDWAGHIDLERLKLSDTTQCVLGQLFDEPVTEPRYLVWGYADANACIRAYGRDEEWATEGVCVANYDAGRIAIGRTLGADLDGTALTVVAREHGFDDADNCFDLLDVFWASEVAARQSGVSA